MWIVLTKDELYITIYLSSNISQLRGKMEKKNIHIISHTHWDREWYMPFEAHRYKLVEFFDRLHFTRLTPTPHSRASILTVRLSLSKTILRYAPKCARKS